MKAISLDRIYNILKVDGRLIASTGCDSHSEVTEVLTDSRCMPSRPGCMFAALRTNINDGARYIREMYDKGVRIFLTETDCSNLQNSLCIRVDNVRKSLAAIAKDLNKEYSGSTIVITGSCGKTRLKEMLYQAFLHSGTRIWRSPRSYNSFIGVTLSRFEAWFDGEHDCEIYEVGIDGPGQAKELLESGMITPNIGVITEITDEHDRNFESHEAKIREKTSLLKDCSKVLCIKSDTLVYDELSASVKECVAAETLQDIVAKFIPEYNTTEITAIESRISICEGIDGNTLMIDGFTNDFRSLAYALDKQNRHASPGQKKVLVLGSLLEGEKVLPKAKDLAQLYNTTIYDESLVLSGCHILFFGKPTAETSALLESLLQADHDTQLEVDLDALVHNYNYYRNLLPPMTGMVAMVKAQGYGMGSIEIGKVLQSHKASYLAVAVIDEGVAMRRAGITMPILILNPITKRVKALFTNKLEPAVFSADELQRLITEARECGIENYPIHIKLDTGMHRVGFTPEQLPEMLEILKGQTQLKVRSVFSHLATADCLDMNSYTQSQIDCYRSGCEKIRHGVGYDFLRHLLNTAGMMRFADSLDYEMARLGIGLYGVSPLPYSEPGLKTVATLRSSIISLKHWPAGTPIGYSCKGRTTCDSVIATVPIGYADGLNRHLGNGATSFIIKGVECPTIGNICMDQCMVDVTAVSDVAVGDHVEIFGHNTPVEKIAAILETIPYEVFTSVSPRVNRLYYTK